MKVNVSFTEVSEDEAAHLAMRLADIKATHAPDDPLSQAGSMEEVYGLLIAREVAAYVARDRDRAVTAQAPLGEVFTLLPPDVQAELRQRLIDAAKANGVDASALAVSP